MAADNSLSHKKTATTGVLKDLLRFVINPDCFYKKDISFKHKTVNTLKVFLITILILAVISLLFELLILVGAFDPIEHNMDVALKSMGKDNYSKSFKLFLFAILLLAVTFEELAFRLALARYRRKFFHVSLSLIMGYLLYNYLFSKILWYPERFFESLILANPIYPLLFATPMYLLFTLTNFDLKLTWRNNFRLVFYLSCIGFAFLHVPSLSLSTNHYLFLPIIMLYYFVMAVSLGYVRIRYGIQYSVGLHYLANLLSILNY